MPRYKFTYHSIALNKTEAIKELADDMMNNPISEIFKIEAVRCKDCPDYKLRETYYLCKICKPNNKEG